ncbi:hypothetical protein [Mesorhizobium sp. ANAO-SY3R2]|uniref:hypothetical protein n=1 Tax=Mesorhizobium sp. ANAO-SY3R2 TaxID=3166644 RepID=UPI0036715BCF
MNLLARVGRIEAQAGALVQRTSIVADDEADLNAQLEALLFSSGPGRLEVSVSMDGQRFVLAGELKSHEEGLKGLA